MTHTITHTTMTYTGDLWDLDDSLTLFTFSETVAFACWRSYCLRNIISVHVVMNYTACESKLLEYANFLVEHKNPWGDDTVI